MTANTDPVRSEPDRLPTVQSTIRALMDRHQVPGLTIAVTDSRRLLHAEGFGHADLASGMSATADTRYPWFSMSKIATATAAMRLADEGRLDLEAPVRSLLPEFAVRAGRTQPRVCDLLSHTAGLSNPLPLRWVLPASAPASDVDEFARRLLSRHGRTRRSAGGPARYSNVSYLALAEVIARAAGRRFDDHMRTAVLDPAGMTATGYDPVPGEDIATGYVRLPRVATPLVRAALPPGIAGRRVGGVLSLHPFRVAGAGYGGLIGSAVDAARLLRLHLADGVIDGHRVLAPESARRMRRINTPGRPFDLGLGWFRRPADRDATPPFVEHWGTGGGFWNAMRLYPEHDLGIVTMANTTRGYDHDAIMAAVRAALRP
ncbi:serine hydrolase domain-containing protein [Modestobacter altitudinis]|uniref:serine hydrolase domain-containing protein n=1 Tax=Modestobacter altitudinis TaxID=2213158 RepID=UPI00110CA030|nr:serine hydrolase domain-containing protein [Modestobacter altitudinis]